MKQYLLLFLCALHCSCIAMKKELSEIEKERKEREFEARMLAMRAEQAKRAQQNQPFTFTQEQSEVPGVGTMHSTSIDFGEGISLEEFTKLFKRPENPQQRAEPKRPVDPAQKEKEFEARMAAMRIEQARRTQQGQQNNNTQQDDFINPGTVFITDFNKEEFNEKQRKQGFNVYPEPDGIVFFCKPGFNHEAYRETYLAEYRMQRQSQNK